MIAQLYSWQDFGMDNTIEIRVDADMLNVIKEYLYRSVDNMIKEREIETALDQLKMIYLIEQKLIFEPTTGGTQQNDAESNS